MTTSAVRPWRNRAIGLAIAAVIFAADQWMKDFVVNTLGLTERGDHYDILPFFDFTRENNFGVSLGLFQATSMEMRWILVAVTALIATVVLVWMLRERLLGDIAALALVLGGALGNIVDRWLFGYVIDYADLHFGGFRPFLIFNVADAAITIGVVLLLARTLFMREKRPDAHAAAHDRPAGDPSRGDLS
jgi:signal peptidase II